MEISTLKKTILRNLDKLEETSYRGRVKTLKLWMEFAFSRKRISDFQKLYKLHQSAWVLLIENEEVNNVEGKIISDSEFELTPKGRETLDKINSGIFKKLYYYFESQIKSEMFKYLILITGFIVTYILGYFKVFMGH